MSRKSLLETDTIFCDMLLFSVLLFLDTCLCLLVCVLDTEACYMNYMKGMGQDYGSMNHVKSYLVYIINIYNIYLKYIYIHI